MPNEIVDFLLKRKSTSKFGEEKPNDEELSKILEVAMTAPDHGETRPYRFVVITEEKRQLFADAMVQTAREKQSDVPEAKQNKIAAKAFLAPMQIMIIFSPHVGHKIPEWEQFATASCAGFAISIAASSLGYATIWKSFGLGAGEAIKTLFSMREHEQLLGWINIGGHKGEPPSRERPDVSSFVSYL